MNQKDNFNNSLNKKPSWMKRIITIILIVVFVFIFLLIVGALLSPDDENKETQNTSTQEKNKDDKKISDESDEESEKYKQKHKFMTTPKEEFNVLNATNVKDIERNPNDFIDQPYKFEGKVIQTLEDDIYTNYRIAIDDEYSSVVLVEIVDTNDNENRILEDDYVTVYSQFQDLTSYESTSGSEITLPKFFSDKKMIELQ